MKTSNRARQGDTLNKGLQQGKIRPPNTEKSSVKATRIPARKQVLKALEYKQVLDDSMAPIFQVGDIIEVSESERPRLGDYVALYTDESCFLLRQLVDIQHRSKVYTFAALNPHWPKLTLHQTEMALCCPVKGLTRKLRADDVAAWADGGLGLVDEARGSRQPLRLERGTWKSGSNEVAR